ncbi:hypothetical protein KA517_03785 [Candidatus Gracilibacteria bacterium]|nr:hypothetical protein [Candidatus Gracilibacteria bacterium]
MEMEIERKWFVRELPDLKGLAPLADERYYLDASDETSIRFQKRGDRYELERMEAQSVLSRTQQKMSLTAGEFERMKKIAMGPLVRDSYLLQRDPQITLKVYGGVIIGLCRVEIEFATEEAAKAFEPLAWFGAEIDGLCPLGRDSQLVQMTREQFLATMQRYQVPMIGVTNT